MNLNSTVVAVRVMNTPPGTMWSVFTDTNLSLYKLIDYSVFVYEMD